MALTTIVEELQKKKQDGPKPKPEQKEGAAHTISNKEARRKCLTNNDFLDGLPRWRIKKKAPPRLLMA